MYLSLNTGCAARAVRLYVAQDCCKCDRPFQWDIPTSNYLRIYM